MKGTCFFCLLSTALLICLKPTTSLRRLHLGQCVISVNIHEIRHSFRAIKDMIQSKDEHTDIRLLHQSYSLQDTEPMDRCCFLRHLLRFYLTTVFSHCKVSSSPIIRKVSRIANTFLSIKKDLRLCMDVHSAGLKALGELDILLDWMDKADGTEI
ncbi:interleukin-20-like [Pelodiscus sinensis]|uniref:interleukin-20-like n=1 Tax=Pelodiscus sinensis TaxID=13735 RepID=UPI003F6BA0E9